MIEAYCPVPDCTFWLLDDVEDTGVSGLNGKPQSKFCRSPYAPVVPRLGVKPVFRYSEMKLFVKAVVGIELGAALSKKNPPLLLPKDEGI